MIVLGVNDICVSFGTNKIIDNVTFSLQDTDKTGVVGVNGAGKSTLFKVITGQLTPDNGEVIKSKNQKLGYLSQNSSLDSDSSIWEELMTAFSHLIEMENKLKLLEEKISTEKNEAQLSSFMKEYSTLSDRFSLGGGYEYNSRAKGILKGLGFDENQFDLKIKSLSGGQKTRLALAKLLLDEPDILLLDEPTNHLDISAIEWLEDYLKNYKKCLVLISHDRYFLDVVTNKTIEIENCECTVYNGNYSSFVKQKAANREIQQKHFELQQKEISRMEAFIEQQKRWNREKNIVAAESRQKAIDRIEKIDKPKDLPDKIRIKFRSSIISGNDVLFVENLSMAYPGKPLFNNVNFNLKRNEKVFLLGPNGCGKTTLLRILSGKIASTSGIFEYGHKINMGYYDQEHENINPDNCILDEVWDANEKLTQSEVRKALASYLFKGEDVFKPISILSGGEKGRVSLLKLMISGANFLILDEPTNHLDINSREILEEALQSFDGTILAVSHDRYFINKLASRILELNKDSMLDCNGNYEFFQQYKNKLNKPAETGTSETKMSAAKQEHLNSKEERAKARKLEKRLSDTEKEIGETEERLSVISVQMLTDEISSDHVKLMELDQEQSSLQKRLDELYELWEELSIQKEEPSN